MRYLYSAILYFLAPIVFIRLWIRSPEHRKSTRERFGQGKPSLPSGRVFWIHAVSFGEVQAARPLIQALRKRWPDLHLLVTTTTITGAAQVQNTLVDAYGVVHCYAPYDLPGVVGRFLDRVAPQILILMETELWPNLIFACKSRGIPVVLANARLSEKSARGYRRFRSLTQETVRNLCLIAVQSQADRDRFVSLGAFREQIQITGNLKFDLGTPKDAVERAEVFRQQIGQHRPVWIAASTHEGEEEIALAAHLEVRKHLPDALLILVPRHPERFSKALSLCREFPTVSWSEQLVPTKEHAVYLGNTMGQLPFFYAISDVAFVGGSLVPVGGHNPLEAAAVGKPVLLGPHCFNFSEITRLLHEACAAKTVQTASSLADLLVEWLQDPVLRNEMGNRGRQVVEANRGALNNLLTFLEKTVLLRND